MTVTEMANGAVLYEVQDGVAVVTLNRPERLNAWTRAMEEAYFDALDRAAEDDTARAIAVVAAGNSFSAGADREELQHFATGEGVPPRHRPVTHPLTVPKPIVAAVQGHCVGIGFVHALMCDMRVVEPSTTFRSAFARLGLVAEHGSSWLLSRMIGHSAALDILLSGRAVAGEEAARLGLANMLVAGDPSRGVADAAIDYARELAVHGSPHSMAVIKRQVYDDLERGLRDAVDDAERRKDAALEFSDFVLAVAGRTDGSEFAPLSASRELIQFAGHGARPRQQSHQTNSMEEA